RKLNLDVACSKQDDRQHDHATRSQPDAAVEALGYQRGRQLDETGLDALRPEVRRDDVAEFEKFVVSSLLTAAVPDQQDHVSAHWLLLSASRDSRPTSLLIARRSTASSTISARRS